MLCPLLRAQFFWNTKYKIASKIFFFNADLYFWVFFAQLTWILNKITQLYSTLGFNYILFSMCISWAARLWICLFPLSGWILPSGNKDCTSTYSDYRLNLVLFLKQPFHCFHCEGNTGIYFCSLVLPSKTGRPFSLGRRWQAI